jgi:hypothetical protein
MNSSIVDVDFEVDLCCLFEGLNESTFYFIRLQSMNSYGESPWSVSMPVQTIESILTIDGNCSTCSCR